MIGTQIGDLTLIRLLGEGAMSKVYLAQHLLLNDLQAVKILDPRFTDDPPIVTRFLDEGRAAVKLRHPNLIAVHNIGRLPDDGPWYMVMEYLDGATLARFRTSLGGSVPSHLIAHILVPVLRCTQWIHDAGVVHRALKPENIILITRNADPHVPKVLDLGVAQLGDAIAAGPGTKTGTMIGTPVYMAPEQLRGERVTARADIFAIGVMAYEMSTGGWFPWQRDDESRSAYLELPMTEIYHRQCSGSPVDPRRRLGGLSEGWASVLLGAIEIDPHRRPQRDSELARLLVAQAPSAGGHDGYAIEPSCAPRPPAEPKPVISDHKLRYQIGAKLGVGGMAEVFEGTLLGVEGFARRVAIKRVLAGLSEVPGFVTMFVAEARITSRLSHTNIVSVMDFDRDDDGRLCLVMEYVHGKDLGKLLATGPIAPSLIIYIVVEMLRGLGYAHAPEPDRDGIVHRDVSPQNLLLSYEGDVKNSDFGLAKVRDTSGSARSETVRGKPSYMSPEQCNGNPLDARSDLFAVGVMLWEMLTHRPLFVGTPKEILSRVLFHEVPRPSSVRSEVPPDLEAITMKLLAFDREGRYPDAEAVIAELLRCEAAPRDGRGELVRVLAERFPDHAMRTRLQGGGAPVVARDLGAAPITRAPLSTLASAASHAVPPAQPVRIPGFGVRTGGGAGVLIGGVAGMIILFALVRSHSAQPAEPYASPIATTIPGGVVPAQVRDAGLLDASVMAPVADAPVADAGLDASASVPAQRISQVAIARRTGELVITVRPWAMIWLNGKSLGQTPYRELIPAGRYRLRIQNDDVRKDETTTVMVPPDETTTIERNW